MCPAPSARTQAAERRARLVQGEDLQAEEWVVTWRDGRKRTLLISTSTMLSNHGRRDGLAMMLDITERGRTDEAKVIAPLPRAWPSWRPAAGPSHCPCCSDARGH